MKTAEEWWDESCPTFESGDEVIEWVKQIQLDSVREGYKRAASEAIKYANEMRGAHVNTGTSSMAICKAILTAAEQITEKDI